jgi:TPR repeat protein
VKVSAGLLKFALKIQNWEDARLFYKKAAEKLHVVALGTIAADAALGVFDFDAAFQFGPITQEDNRRPPDWEESFRLYREAARLGHAGCCARLGQYYRLGKGIAESPAKGFKWSKVAAEKGDAMGMFQCAECYFLAKGVDQSNEQAIYWLEKYLELEDDESARNNLAHIRGLSTGAVR